MKTKLILSSTLFLLSTGALNLPLASANGDHNVFNHYSQDGLPNWSEEKVREMEKRIEEAKLKRMAEESRIKEEQIRELYKPRGIVQRPLPAIPANITKVTNTNKEEVKTLSVPVVAAPIKPLSKKEEYLFKINNKLVDKYIIKKGEDFKIDPSKTYKEESLKSLKSFHFVDAYRYHKAQKYANEVYLEKTCKPSPSKLGTLFSHLKKIFQKKETQTLSPDFLKKCVNSYEGAYTQEGMLRLTPSLLSFPKIDNNLDCKNLEPDVLAKIVKDQFKEEYGKNPLIQGLLLSMVKEQSEEGKKRLLKEFLNAHPDTSTVNVLEAFFKVSKNVYANEATSKMGEAAMTNLFFMMVGQEESQAMIWILKNAVL